MAKATSQKPTRVECRFEQELVDKIDHFKDVESTRLGQNLSRNDFLRLCAEHYIAWIVSDYDVPVATVQRMNQMVDALNGVTSRLATLEDTTYEGFNALMQLRSASHNYLANDPLRVSDED